MGSLPKHLPLIDRLSGFRLLPPKALVPVEHFTGTNLSSNEFAFYGERHRLGRSIDWEANPGTWHWGHDLNRFGFLLLYDADPTAKTAQQLLRLIEDWLNKNGDQPRAGSPYAWQNLLNVAIRIENWWRFLEHVVRRCHCDPASPLLQRIAHSAMRQAFSLLRMIRSRGFKDNWSLIGLRAALYILYAVDQFPQRPKLIAIAQGYLRTAMSEQILPDGAQQELSPHYHWVALELIVSIRQLALEANDADASWLDAPIHRMTRFLNALISPSGAIVSLGDSDAEYGRRIQDFLDEHVGDRETSEANSDEPQIQSFPYAGLACVRHRSTESLLVFDGGPYGTNHQHEDALSFWLCAFGEDILVDPGRYLYEKGSQTFYAHLKSTAAHSTIRIDGFDQNAAAFPARWRRSEPGGPYVESVGGMVRLSAKFIEGYGPKTVPVQHQRDISVSDNGLTLHIRDTLTGDGRYGIEQIWIVSPGEWALDDRRFWARRGKAMLEIACSARPGLVCRVVEGARNPIRGWYSPRLNIVVPTPALIVSGLLTLPSVIETVIRVTPA